MSIRTSFVRSLLLNQEQLHEEEQDGSAEQLSEAETKQFKDMLFSLQQQTQALAMVPREQQDELIQRIIKSGRHSGSSHGDNLFDLHKICETIRMLPREKWSSAFENYIVFYLVAQETLLCDYVLTNQKNWHTILVPFLLPPKNNSLSMANERRLTTLVISAISVILNRSIVSDVLCDGKEYKKKKDRYKCIIANEIRCTLDAIETVCGWTEESVMIASMILYTTVSRACVSAQQYRNNLDHPAWQNLAGMIYAIEDFIFYRPTGYSAKAKNFGIHLDRRGAMDGYLIEKILHLLIGRLRIFSMAEVLERDKSAAKRQKSLQKLLTVEANYLSLLMRVFTLTNLSDKTLNDLSLVMSKRMLHEHLKQKKIRELLSGICDSVLKAKAQSEGKENTADPNNYEQIDMLKEMAATLQATPTPSSEFQSSVRVADDTITEALTSSDAQDSSDESESDEPSQAVSPRTSRISSPRPNHKSSISISASSPQTPRAASGSKAYSISSPQTPRSTLKKHFVMPPPPPPPPQDDTDSIAPPPPPSVTPPLPPPS